MAARLQRTVGRTLAFQRHGGRWDVVSSEGLWSNLCSDKTLLAITWRTGRRGARVGVERLSGRLWLPIREKMVGESGKLAAGGWTLDVCSGQSPWGLG